MSDDLTGLELLYTTRAMRRLGTDPVDDDTVAKILDGAIRGPSGANRMRVRFVVVRDDERKVRIQALYEQGLSIGISKVNTEGERAADVFYVVGADGKKVDVIGSPYLVANSKSRASWAGQLQDRFYRATVSAKSCCAAQNTAFDCRTCVFAETA